MVRKLRNNLYFFMFRKCLIICIIVFIISPSSANQYNISNFPQPESSQDVQYLRSKLKENISPGERLKYSCQIAQILASEKQYKESLEYVDDCLSLIQNDKPEDLELYYRFLKIPVIYAWRQHIAKEKPLDAVALDRTIGIIFQMILLTHDDSTQYRELITSWLGSRFIDYNLTRDSPCPNSLFLLLISIYRSESDELSTWESIKKNLEYLDGILEEVATQNPGEKEILLKKANEEFYHHLLESYSISYLKSQKEMLCQKNLSKNYYDIVERKEEPQIGDIISYRLESVTENIQMIKDSRKQREEIRAKIKSAKNRVQALEKQKEKISSLDISKMEMPPEPPDFLSPNQTDELIKLNSGIANEMEKLSESRKKLSEAKQKEDKINQEFEEIYRKAFGRREIVVKNTSSRTLVVYISFYKSGMWYNTSFYKSWRIGPFKTIHPGYDGKPIRCSKYKIVWSVYGAPKPPKAVFDCVWIQTIGKDEITEFAGEHLTDIP